MSFNLFASLGIKYIIIYLRMITGQELLLFQLTFMTICLSNISLVHGETDPYNKLNGNKAQTENLLFKTTNDVSYAVILILIIDHKWNKEKIILSLCVEKTVELYDYYVVGNISELGRWKINNKMKKNQFKTPSS
jgi:hypothetical protein